MLEIFSFLLDRDDRRIRGAAICSQFVVLTGMARADSERIAQRCNDSPRVPHRSQMDLRHLSDQI